MDDQQIIDLCVHGLRDPDSARPLPLRLHSTGNIKINKTAKACHGHGKVTHQRRQGRLKAVSYTHLTLPTILRV